VFKILDSLLKGISPVVILLLSMVTVWITVLSAISVIEPTISKLFPVNLKEDERFLKETQETP